MIVAISVLAVAAGYTIVESKAPTPNSVKKETVQEVEDVVMPVDQEVEVTLPKKKVTRLNPDPSRTLVLKGVVGKNVLGLAEELNKLQSESTEPIYIVITSPGGSVLAGAALISAMQASRAPVYTVCDIFCASMGAMIHQYETKRYMTDRSVLMFHPATSEAGGDVDRIFSYAKMMRRYINKMELYVAKRVNISFEQYKAESAVELWIDSEDSLTRNFADKIVTIQIPESELAVNEEMSNIKLNSRDLIWITQ